MILPAPEVTRVIEGVIMDYKDEGIKKFIEINGNIDEALAYLKGAIKKSKGTIAEHALIYAYGKLLQYKD